MKLILSSSVPAERAFATVNGQILREHSCTLELRVHPSAENPRPTAEPRLFKSLPPSTTAGGLFDVCRKFGPVFRVTMGSGADASSVPKGQAIVVFLVSETHGSLRHVILG
jgi:polyadenylate-binding protein